MKFTRRALGEAVAAAALLPAAALAQAPPAPSGERNWLAEARDSRTASARAIAGVPLPIDVEPAFRFHA